MIVSDRVTFRFLQGFLSKCHCNLEGCKTFCFASFVLKVEDQQMLELLHDLGALKLHIQQHTLHVLHRLQTDKRPFATLGSQSNTRKCVQNGPVHCAFFKKSIAHQSNCLFPSSWRNISLQRCTNPMGCLLQLPCTILQCTAKAQPGSNFAHDLSQSTIGSTTSSLNNFRTGVQAMSHAFTIKSYQVYSCPCIHS